MSRLLALYGVRPLEDHHQADDQVRRAFYVDGYGSDVIAIAFVRTPGTDPSVSIHLPRRDGHVSTPLVASVPESVWNDAIRDSELFDRQLEPIPMSPGWESICMHSWQWTIEATDPSFVDAPRTRRRTEGDCANGLASRYANDLATTALSLFSHCQGLDLRDIALRPTSLLNAFFCAAIAMRRQR